MYSICYESPCDDRTRPLMSGGNVWLTPSSALPGRDFPQLILVGPGCCEPSDFT